MLPQRQLAYDEPMPRRFRQIVVTRRSRCWRARRRPPRVIGRVSERPGGGEPRFGQAFAPLISADGRRVLFTQSGGFCFKDLPTSALQPLVSSFVSSSPSTGAVVHPDTSRVLLRNDGAEPAGGPAFRRPSPT